MDNRNERDRQRGRSDDDTERNWRSNYGGREEEYDHGGERRYGRYRGEGGSSEYGGARFSQGGEFGRGGEYGRGSEYRRGGEFGSEGYGASGWRGSEMGRGGYPGYSTANESERREFGGPGRYGAGPRGGEDWEGGVNRGSRYGDVGQSRGMGRFDYGRENETGAWSGRGSDLPGGREQRGRFEEGPGREWRGQSGSSMDWEADRNWGGQGGQNWGANRDWGGRGGSSWGGQERMQPGQENWGGYGGSTGMMGGNINTFGTRGGQFSGRGPKNYHRSDTRIQEDVCERLTQDPNIDASEIEVKVDGGQVTLTGTVNDRNQKRVAEDIVESIPGVREVQNQVRLGHQEGGQFHTTGQQTQGQQNLGQTGNTGQTQNRQNEPSAQLGSVDNKRK